MNERPNQPVRVAAANLLAFAAAPTFAAMALAAAVLAGGKMEAICSATREPAWLGGMIPMYLLMSAFHLSPWLNLLGTRRASRGHGLRA